VAEQSSQFSQLIDSVGLYTRQRMKPSFAETLASQINMSDPQHLPNENTCLGLKSDKKLNSSNLLSQTHNFKQF